MASCRCNVKNVTRLDGGAAVVNLLGNDLGDRFQVDFLTLDRLPRRRDVRDGVSHDEVDLAETLERQFEESGAIAAVVRWPDLELEIVQLGIEKGQELVAGNGTGDTRWKVPGVLDWSTGIYNPRVDISKDTTTL